MKLKSDIVEIRGINTFSYKSKKEEDKGAIKTMYQISVEDDTGMPEIIIIDEQNFVKVKKGSKCVLYFEKTEKGTYFRTLEIVQQNQTK